MSSIPEEWIKNYVDELISLAMKYPDGVMQSAVALRAEHVMDMVKAWREDQEKKP